MRIGIFGGTFNPPHITHNTIIENAISELQLDKMIVIPNGIPPHKPCDVDKATRLKLCELAFSNIPKVEISRYEIDKDGESYSFLTLQHYKKMYQDSELFFLIGMDSLRDFHKWKNPQEIADIATLAVCARVGIDTQDIVAEQTKRYHCKVVIVDSCVTDISSTTIRLNYDFGIDNCAYTLPIINRYILDNFLYMSRLWLTTKLKTMLTPKRYMHSYYVTKKGLEICEEQDREKVFIACALHDCAKYIDKKDYSKYNYANVNNLPDNIVHAELGAYVAQKDFGISDIDILNAIRYHTTGRVAMSRLEMTVFVADKIEDNRPFETLSYNKGNLEETFIAVLDKIYHLWDSDKE
ncbi:MAG: nicotinate (nicotinamide) nucleotide adenylyltransferase, partial [Clostridia bacterium]